ncbi:N-acetylneuraminate synthase [Acinetobacter sp. NIPH1876]|uniref:N-acetylneuraminate synthase n=1 Tax=Acinetobacter sp. NIPH1876 TaxID=2924041 RepID=UPI001FAB9018|nr:N-acetylneuraminate synthase [Acinetobacter sp. NIPH1876]MCJ0829597.1 N-acetylneuraminate synthase [Acinetobacter sp. NIPH1876]
MIWANKTFLIAEAGVNHNGDLEKAYQLIDAAAEAKVDAIKFQSFKADNLVSKSAKMAEYQKQNLGYEDSQYAMLKKLEIPVPALSQLKNYAESKGLIWFSTAFDFESIDTLIELDIPVWKIPSGEITNYPYLKKIAALNKPVILSTGMCNLADIEAALKVFLDCGRKREEICILHCNTEYPTPWTDVNLKAMVSMGQIFGTAYGYSDHTTGITVPTAAVALGAKVIEKHFTLDKNLPGPDHKASLEPHELKAMVDSIRVVEQVLGSSIKFVSDSERKNIHVARKSIVAATDIQKGELMSEDVLTTMRPGDGISPMFWNEVVGQPAVRDYKAGDKIEW